MAYLAKSNHQVQAKLLRAFEGRVKIGQKVDVRHSDLSGFEVYDKDIKLGYVDDFWSSVHLENISEVSKIESAVLSGLSGRRLSIQLRLIAEIPDFDYLDPLSSSAGIYALRIESENAIYVGQTRDFRQRIEGHFKSLAFGVHINRGLQEIYRDHGIDAFHVEVIENLPNQWSGTVADQSWLAEREQHWIAHYKNQSGIRCLNKTSGEFIETKKTLEQKRIDEIALQQAKAKADAEHDQRVRAEKLRLREEIAKAEQSLEVEEARTKPLRMALHSHESWLADNATFFTIFLSRNRRQELSDVRRKTELLRSEVHQEMQKTLLLNQELKKLKKELNSKKTSRQLAYYSSLQRRSIYF
jgi:hypothetical protein